MRLSRSKRSDEGVYEFQLSKDERLIVHSNHGTVIIDHRGKDMNLFHVTTEKKRIELGRFENKRLI
jgi:hypothetical protein